VLQVQACSMRRIKNMNENGASQYDQFCEVQVTMGKFSVNKFV
jgi:hypothetical protein